MSQRPRLLSSDEFQGQRLKDVGYFGYDLCKLYSVGVNIVPSLIATTALFKDYLKTRQIVDDTVEMILSFARKYHFRRLRFSTTSATRYIGMLESAEAAANFSQTKYTIERIFRSWFDETALSYRLTEQIEDKDSFPAIVIQAVYSRRSEMHTRSVETGDPTNRSNIDDGNPRLKKPFGSRHRNLIRKAEETLGKPVTLTFLEIPRLLVIGVSPLELCDSAHRNAGLQLLRQGCISESDFLLSIQPDSIAYPAAPAFIAKDTIKFRGLPASSGFGAGRLVFRSSPVKRSAESEILLVSDMEPGDIEKLHECSAAIGTVGGMSSHLAVVSRGLGKPAVVGTGGTIDERERSLFLSNGVKAYEGMLAIVNGTAGTVQVSPSQEFFQPSFAGSERIYLEAVIDILRSVSGKHFSRLPVNIQQHVAALKHRLIHIGAI